MPGIVNNEKCGRVLEASTSADRNGRVTIAVTPCEHSLDEARDAS